MTPRGFSLMEAVLTIGVVGAGLVGLIFSFGHLKSSSLLVDQSTIALNIAQETMEKIIAKRDCDSIGCGYAGARDDIINNVYDANPVAGFTGFVLDTSVIEVNPDDDNGTDDFLDSQGSSGYSRVTVLVSWNGGANTTKLETLIANY